MLAEAITGRSIRGSWMADREVFRIYKLLKKIYKSEEISSLPLILGKETLVHASLGPAIARVAGDSERRSAARAELPPLARRLLDEVEASGEVRMDRWTASTAQGRHARLRLERDLLVMSRDLHAERGYHTAIVMPWSQSKIAARYGVEGQRLRFPDAVDQVIVAGVRSAVIAPEREVRRWFVFGRERIDELVRSGGLVQFKSDNAAWITLRKAAPVRTSLRRAGRGR